jgi:hypothetical protein
MSQTREQFGAEIMREEEMMATVSFERGIERVMTALQDPAGGVADEFAWVKIDKVAKLQEARAARIRLASGKFTVDSLIERMQEEVLDTARGGVKYGDPLTALVEQAKFEARAQILDRLRWVQQANLDED